MNANELWDYAMNPNSRSLLKMTLGQAEKTYKAYSSIMGKDPY
jgi:DNA gyrase/topoisomerase IV subunit B